MSDLVAIAYSDPDTARQVVSNLGGPKLEPGGAAVKALIRRRSGGRGR
jgi:hypothetical protein